MTETEKTVRAGGDYLVRASAAGAQLRAFAVTGRELVQQAHENHGTSPVATAALGRTLCGALMMADMLKGEDDLLTIKIDGDGPLGGIVVTADNRGHVKGYVHHPQVWIPDRVPGHLNVGGAVGQGSLTVIRDLGLKDPYIGRISLHSGEIAEDLTYYYMESEQIPSTVGLGVLVDTDESVLEAGGFVVQLMPDAQEEIIARLEQNLQGLPSVTAMLQEGMTPEDILEKILEGLSPVITEKIPVSFRCDCSEERCERGLILLGEEELKSLIEEDREVEMTCQFCGRRYSFSRDRLEQLLPLTAPVSRADLEETLSSDGEEVNSEPEISPEPGDISEPEETSEPETASEPDETAQTEETAQPEEAPVIPSRPEPKGAHTEEEQDTFDKILGAITSPFTDAYRRWKEDREHNFRRLERSRSRRKRTNAEKGLVTLVILVLIGVCAVLYLLGQRGKSRNTGNTGNSMPQAQEQTQQQGAAGDTEQPDSEEGDSSENDGEEPAEDKGT